MTVGEDKLKGIEREVIEAALRELSRLIDAIEESSQGGHTPPPIDVQHIMVLFEEAFETRAPITLEVLDGSRLACADTTFDESPRFARSLYEIGAQRLTFDRTLSAELLVRFVKVLLSPRRHDHPEHHPASFWFEQGGPGITLVETALPEAERDPLPCFQPLLLAARAPEELAEAIDLDAHTPVAAHAPPNYDPTITGRLQARVRDLDDETEGAVRKSFGLNLMAAMGARKPALTAHEIAFINCKLMSEMFIAGEYEAAHELLVHLEYLNSPGARLPSHTREMASTALKHLCSNHMLMILAKTSEHYPDALPSTLVDWYMAGDPLVIWRAAITHAGEDDLTALTKLFLRAREPSEPFWHNALEALSETQRAQVTRALGAPADSVHSRGPWTRRSTGHHAVPDASKAPHQDDDPFEDSDDDILFGEPVWEEEIEADEGQPQENSQPWGAFDLDAILLSEPVWEEQKQWDSSLDAFLAPGESSVPPEGRGKSSILNSMIGHLDALEKSAIARTNFGLASQRGQRRRRRYWKGED